MAFCFKCGANIPEGNAFCGVCGTNQREIQQPKPQQPPYQQPANPSPQQPPYSPYRDYRPAQPDHYQPGQQIPRQDFDPPQPPRQGYEPPRQDYYPPQPPRQEYYPPQQDYYPPQPPQSPQQPRRRSSPVGNAAIHGAGQAAKAAAKGGSSLLKWLLPLLALAVAAAAAVFLMAPQKSDEQLIRERIAAFEKAYNDGDYDGILDCLDSQMQAATDITMSMMDGLMGEMIGFDIGMSDMFGLAGMMGDFCDIEILSIDIDGDYASVDISMTMNMYGMSQSEEINLPMVKDGRNWYIGGLEGLMGSGYLGW